MKIISRFKPGYGKVVLFRVTSVIARLCIPILMLYALLDKSKKTRNPYIRIHPYITNILASIILQPKISRDNPHISIPHATYSPETVTSSHIQRITLKVWKDLIVYA